MIDILQGIFGGIAVLVIVWLIFAEPEWRQMR